MTAAPSPKYISPDGLNRLVMQCRQGVDEAEERRASERVPWTTPLRCSTGGEADDAEAVFDAVGVNISKSGCGFITRSFVTPGQPIVIVFDGPEGAMALRGEVVGCTLMADFMHRVGVRFASE